VSKTPQAVFAPASNPKMTDHEQKFEVEGSRKLNGVIKVSGSKNAALPILCAALLSNEPSEIDNIPDIADIHTLFKIFEELNVKVIFKNHKAKIDPSKLKLAKITDKYINSMRASFLLLGPLLQRFPEVHIPFPGGCVLSKGKRSASTHSHVFKAVGAEVLEDVTAIHLRRKKLHAASVTMPELSVTATENLLMLAAQAPGTTEIRLAAMEPHVQDLCKFLVSMGAKIKGIGTHHLIVEGVKTMHGAKHTITGDYLEAGTFAIASLVTGGEVTIKGIETNQLDSFWEKLTEAGAKFTLKPDEVKLYPSPKLRAIEMLRTAVYPSFPTDLQAPFVILLTQAEGQSKIFETLFDNRLNYLFELEKMGANVEILNPHQAIISGPTPLKGVPIISSDIRAGAAMVLAALCAKGTTEVANIKYIDRGYENFDRKLQSLGAKIRRV
jgi:UDP-N-acetylglucosamine 1-carboxyvinyltransferase